MLAFILYPLVRRFTRGTRLSKILEADTAEMSSSARKQKRENGPTRNRDNGRKTVRPRSQRSFREENRRISRGESEYPCARGGGLRNLFRNRMRTFFFFVGRL